MSCQFHYAPCAVNDGWLSLPLCLTNVECVVTSLKKHICVFTMLRQGLTIQIFIYVLNYPNSVPCLRLNPSSGYTPVFNLLYSTILLNHNVPSDNFLCRFGGNVQKPDSWQKMKHFKEMPYFVIAITYHVFAKEMIVVPRLGLSVARNWWLSNMRNTWSLLFWQQNKHLPPSCSSVSY